jgi:hypothetical protein
MEPNLIPTLDPNPLSAPYWVFKLLLVVTFFLHILAMNCVLGGGVLALWAKRRSKNREMKDRLFFDIAKKLPSLLPATITLGIAPLLFVQVLYGQFFYTSSIILAWPWFLVLVLLTIAYYGFYYVSFRNAQQPGKASGMMLLSVVLVFLIGFVYSNNLTLSQTPLRWRAKYFAHPGGWNLNLTEPTLIPRFLHFFTAAVAVGGLLLVLVAFAKRKHDAEYSRHVFHFGGKAFMYATMAQFALGIAFLASLPRDIGKTFLGDDALATVLLLFGVAGAISAVFLMAESLHKENVSLAAYSVPAITAGVILSMSLMRALLRDAYLKPYFHPEQFAVKTQWSVLPLFLALFVGGGILWFVMLQRYGWFAEVKVVNAQLAQATGSEARPNRA